VLLRHGQFSFSSLGLTPLGRKQADRAGQRLRAFAFTRIHCSTMKRAQETARIIAKHHRPLVPARAHLLRECLPTMPRDRRRSLSVSIDVVRRGKERADRAYRRYFARR